MASLRRCVAIAGFAVAGTVVLAPAAQGVDAVRIVNNSGRSADNVWVVLHGGSSSDGQLPADTPRKLSQLSGQQFTLGNANAGLRLFFSYDHPVAFNVDPNVSKTRFDFVELNNASGGGVADLTSVDWFAIPFKLETLDAAGGVVGTLQSPNTDVLLNALSGVAGPGAIVTTDTGAFARILAPTKAPGSYPDLTPYVQSLNGLTITIHGRFDPTNTIYVYTGTFAPNGDITLNGTLNGSPGQPLGVTGATLPHAAYTNTSGVTGQDYTVGGTPHTLTDNDVYSAIYRDVVTGLSLGYVGGRYGNDSSAWYPLDGSPSPPAFSAARSSFPGFVAYDQWAAVIGQYSDAYGFPFHDRYQGHSVLLGLNPPATVLRITIKPDAAPPSGGSGGGGGPGGSGGSDAGAGPTPPEPPPPTGTALVRALDLRASAIVRRGRATVGEAACPAMCGTVRLLATTSSAGVARKRRLRTTTVGHGATRVATGESRPLVLTLTAKARRALAHKRRLRVALTVSVTADGATGRVTRPLALRSPARSKR
jgi:hypothetical protein